MEEGRKLHELAAKARENGNHLEALQLEDEAMLTYQKDGNILGFAEIIADRSLVLRHLADETGNENFRRLAKAEMIASVQIARQGDKSAIAIPLFNLAKVQEELDEIEDASATYKEAVLNMENNPPENHNRPAVLADFKIHLYTCEYATGDKSALERTQQALSELEEADEEKYNKDVWLSGAHMRIAKMLRADDPEKANDHLQKAKEIIDTNPELKLRKKQWEKLSLLFSESHI